MDKKSPMPGDDEVANCQRILKRLYRQARILQKRYEYLYALAQISMKIVTLHEKTKLFLFFI